MIDVVLMSDGWPCQSDVQACIKNHLYEKPVSLIKGVHAKSRACAQTAAQETHARR